MSNLNRPRHTTTTSRKRIADANYDLNDYDAKTYSEENRKVDVPNSQLLYKRKRKCAKLKTKVEFVPTSCRICLNNGDIPIFGEDTVSGLSVAICKLTDVKIEEDDEFPKYLCHSCNEQLQNALLFRQLAQESDKLLRESESGYTNTNEPSYSDEECQTDVFPNIFYQKCDFKPTLQDEHTTFHCSKCDLDFTNTKVYAKHMLTIDHKDMSDTCPFCCRQFKCIVRHLTLHKKHKTHQCDICGQKFMNPNYTNHLESHFDNLPFKCPECPYKGRFSGDFKIHMRKHTGEKPYQCSECPQRFTSKSNLNRHSSTHKSESYQCDVCNKIFFSQTNLDLHKKRVHSGEKLFNCEKCGKCFALRTTLMKHTLRVHKREKLRSGRTPNYLKITDMKKDDAGEEDNYLRINN